MGPLFDLETVMTQLWHAAYIFRPQKHSKIKKRKTTLPATATRAMFPPLSKKDCDVLFPASDDSRFAEHEPSQHVRAVYSRSVLGAM